MTNEYPVSVHDLERFRRVMDSCLTVFEATDIANAEMNLQSIRHRPLTNAVASSIERIEGLLAVALLEQHKADEEIVPVREVSIPLPEEDEIEQPEQLQLFDPDTYENPEPVKAHNRKYRMLADE